MTYFTIWPVPFTGSLAILESFSCRFSPSELFLPPIFISMYIHLFLYVQGLRYLTLLPLLHWEPYTDTHWNLSFVFYVNAYNNVNALTSTSAQATLVHCSVNAELVLTSSGWSLKRYVIWSFFFFITFMVTHKEKNERKTCLLSC